MDKGLLDIYSDYLISQSHYATATGLADLLNGEISHDKVSRFLRLEDYESKELWSYIKPAIRQHEQDGGGVLLLDDTISEKHYTDENAINCWQFSHAKHRHVKGINLLSCLVRYDDIALPIGYEIVKKETQYSDLATRKLKCKAEIGKNDLFRSLIQQAVKNEVLFDYILADNWFGSKANMTFIQQDLKKYFIVGIKSNRCIAMTEEGAKSGQFQRVNSLDWKDGDCNTVYLKDLAFPVKLLKKIFTNEDESTGILYLAANDLTIDADRIYEVYQKRWRIEEFHKSIKQNASLSKSPTKNHSNTSQSLICCDYCLLQTGIIKGENIPESLRHSTEITAQGKSNYVQ